MDEQRRLEASLLSACLRREGTALSDIDRLDAFVQARDTSGSGFVTSFKRVEALKLLPESVSGDLNSLHGRLNNAPEPVGFIVMFEEGRLMWIEGFTYLGDPWPKIETFELYEA